MSTERNFLMATAAIAIVTGATSVAHAADNSAINLGDEATARNFQRDRNIAVMQRPRPDYDAAGVRAGSFMLYPRLVVGVDSNDNIFAQKTKTTSDTLWHIQPEVSLASDWNRHSLLLYARGDLTRYSKNDTENTDDFGLGARGRIDVSRATNLTGGASFDQQTEPRTSPNAPTAAKEPTQYDLTKAYVGASHEFNRLKLAGNFNVAKYNYEDVATGAGGKLDQDYRDRTVTALTGRADYAISPDTALFVEVTGNRRDYRQDRPTVALTRDSDGVNAYVGANFELGAVARGEIGVGYMKQNYKDAAAKDADGFGARAKVEWFPTQITTVTLSGSRAIEDSASQKIASYVANRADLSVDHELLRNVILSANVGTGKDEYQGSTRKDKVVNAGLRGTYLINRRVGLTGAYFYEKRDTEGLIADRGAEYEVNKVSASLTVQF